MELWEVIVPAEANEYCMFIDELENDPLVFFHAAPLRHKSSIVEKGFQSAAILGVGELQSVSYAKKSSGCLAHLGCNISEDYAVFAVKFQPQELDRVVNNPSDIHVYDQSVQPQILGYCVLNAGFNVV
ncbi:hypothetical protein [Litchfieldella anticariensis]|nr:hypothetical protein [Halomonas anticariensis]